MSYGTGAASAWSWDIPRMSAEIAVGIWQEERAAWLQQTQFWFACVQHTEAAAFYKSVLLEAGVGFGFSGHTVREAASLPTAAASPGAFPVQPEVPAQPAQQPTQEGDGASAWEQPKKAFKQPVGRPLTIGRRKEHLLG